MLRFNPKDFNLKILPQILQEVSTLDSNKEYSIEIKKISHNRSKNANKYMWELCNLMADELSKEGTSHTKEEIYRNAIQQVGIYKDFENLKPSDADTLKIAWGRLGTGWIAEQVDYMPDGENIVLRCYYGSSTYNTKQMARLIDFIIRDCKALGIDVMTEEERSLLLSDWQKQTEQSNSDSKRSC